MTASSPDLIVGERTFLDTIGNTGDGIVLIDAARVCLFANAAASRILGLPLPELIGADVLNCFPEADRARIDGVIGTDPADRRGSFYSVLAGADGIEREVFTSAFVLDSRQRPQCVLLLRELVGEGARDRTAAVMARAAGLVGTGSTEEILSGIAALVVANSRALACGIVVVGDDRQLAVGGSDGYPARKLSRQVWTADAVVIDDIPGIEPVLDNELSVLIDGRRRWEADPVMAPFTATLADVDWRDVVLVPVSWDGAVHGVFAAYLPTGAPAPTESDLQLYTELADQAAVVIAYARVAAADERTRLARELHDSVSQGLFSMNMHARAAQISLRKTGNTDAGLRRSVDQLAELTKGTLAEMRALIFELRPGALAEEGLLAAVTKQAAALTAREQVQFTVEGPSQRIAVGSAAEEHLYRITCEAMHNVVKHARARTAQVRIGSDTTHVTVTVTDDGIGFDPDTVREGRLGLTTMAQRAALIGAEFTLTSTPGNGATVELRIPLPRREDGTGGQR
ncbi:putative two-component system sensor kinase [Nocardia nova SH22a]|uniref:Putative two-component system sensor kinase n=1 Tax=Nocardia nova SH22a TaxID=1415166 RepID=W5TGC5_9NOCA|nr:histidine kinase [Nocardia nova]AHH16301.1 putative two-component system sensor kinase [Nocardia nova SH22a]